MALLSDDISICTIVGSGSAFVGNMRVNGAMMIDGDVDGDLEVSGNLIIGEKARVRGNISAKSAVISGIVLGDIATHRLQIANGVVFHGHCIALSDEDLFEKEAVKQRQLRQIKSKTIIK